VYICLVQTEHGDDFTSRKRKIGPFWLLKNAIQNVFALLQIFLKFRTMFMEGQTKTKLHLNSAILIFWHLTIHNPNPHGYGIKRAFFFYQK
jgi:hypothetical protein